MQSSLEQAYSAIERSYGEGRFAEAMEQALALQQQLESGRSDQLDQRLQLLIGHIHLYGLAQPEQAATAYTAVLENCREATIRELAEQSLQRCGEPKPSGSETPPAGELPATPWLTQLREPEQALAEIQQAWSTVIPAAAPEPPEPSEAASPATPWRSSGTSTQAPMAAPAPEPETQPEPEPAPAPEPEPAVVDLDPGLLLVRLASRTPVAPHKATAGDLPVPEPEEPAGQTSEASAQGPVKITPPSLGAAWTLFRRHWRTYLSLEALVVAAALLGALLQLIGSGLQSLAEANPLLAIAPGLALFVAAIALNLWSNLLGVSLQMAPALAFASGSHPSARAMLALLRRNFWRYVRAGLVVGVATSAGLLLLIVPGLLVMIATPVVVRRVTCNHEKAWPAVLASVKEVSNGPAGAGLLKWQLIAGLLVLASVLLCGVPLLITVPLGGILIQHYLAWSGLGVSPQPPNGGAGSAH
jgi:hypothetical protein